MIDMTKAKEIAWELGQKLGEVVEDAYKQGFDDGSIQPVKQETVTEFADRCRECGKMRTGHWITTRTFMHDGEFYCDRCKCESPNNEKWDYCPNCGAEMVKQQESEVKKKWNILKL